MHTHPGRTVDLTLVVRSGLQVCDLPLAVVGHQAGRGQLGGSALLPQLEGVEAALTCPEQRPLQAVQPLHQRRCVLIVRVLGRVHGAAEAADEGLVKTRRSED